MKCIASVVFKKGFTQRAQRKQYTQRAQRLNDKKYMDFEIIDTTENFLRTLRILCVLCVKTFLAKSTELNIMFDKNE